MALISDKRMDLLGQIFPTLPQEDLKQAITQMDTIPKRRTWTSDEITYMRKHRELTTREIANVLGREIPSVKNKRSRLGLRYQPPKPRRTMPEYLRDAFVGMVARVKGTS